MPSHTLHVVQAFEERDGGVVPAEPKACPSAASTSRGRRHLFWQRSEIRVNNVDFVRWTALWSSIVLTRIGVLPSGLLGRLGITCNSHQFHYLKYSWPS